MYLYESHMGGIYTTEDRQSYDSLYCETCGDSDWELGEFDTLEEFWNLIIDEVSVNGSGGLSLQYILPPMEALFDYPFTLEYESPSEMEYGFCCNSDKDILLQVEEAIQKERKKK